MAADFPKRRLHPLLTVAFIAVSAVAVVMVVLAVFRYLDTHFMGFHRTWVYRRAQLCDPAALAELLRGCGVAGPFVSAALMVASSLVLAFPTAFIVFANAFIWGFAKGTALTFASSLGAACLCFALSRRFGRPLVERLNQNERGNAALALTDKFFMRYGGRAVLIARLIPVIPFDLISLVAGLSGMRFGHFLASTTIGIFPAIAIYSWLASRGAATHKMQSLMLVLLIFAALAVVLLIAQKPLLNRLLRNKE